MFLSIVQLVAHAVVQSSFYFGKHSLISKLLHCAYDAMIIQLLLISLWVSGDACKGGRRS